MSKFDLTDGLHPNASNLLYLKVFIFTQIWIMHLLFAQI